MFINDNSFRRETHLFNTSLYIKTRCEKSSRNTMCLTADLKVIYVHDLLKIVGNSVSNIQIAFISKVTYLGLHSLALPVLAHSGI